MFLFINIIVRTIRKLTPFIGQFSPNLFALGQIFLENQLSHCTCKYVNLRLQTAEMEDPVQDFCLWSPIAKLWVVPLGFAIHKAQAKSPHIPNVH